MRCYFLSLFLFLIHSFALAQEWGGVLRNSNRVEIPFEYRNDLMIVDVRFNRLFPLKFIFDTGAENTILSRREITDIMAVPYEREFTVMGADLKTELKAYLVRNIFFEVGKGVIPNHSMLVLDEDYFRLGEIVGMEIHGILGADIFRGMVVRVNYERRMITLIRKNHFQPPRNYQSIPIEVYRNKAYLESAVVIRKGVPRQMKLLLDSGAMVSVLLSATEEEGLLLPPDVLSGKIGAGLGGFIEGYLGRIESLKIGNVDCPGLLTNFQELPENIDTTVLNGRDGIIGNKLLSRFHLVIDYPGEMLYYRPNKKFKNKDEYDKSGLVVIAADVNLNKFIVHDVLGNSPAEEAGLEPGDRIVRVNWVPAALLNLSTVHRILRKREGKRIKLVVKRNGERLKFQFELRELI